MVVNSISSERQKWTSKKKLWDQLGFDLKTYGLLVRNLWVGRLGVTCSTPAPW